LIVSARKLISMSTTLSTLGRDMAELAPVTACFSLLTEAEPGAMPRVLQVFAKRGLVPHSWISRLEGPGELSIDVQIQGMGWDEAEQLAAGMRQIPTVRTVLTSQRHHAG
jgi:acetolactate synthase small subunit